MATSSDDKSFADFQALSEYDDGLIGGEQDDTVKYALAYTGKSEVPSKQTKPSQYTTRQLTSDLLRKIVYLKYRQELFFDVVADAVNLAHQQVQDIRITVLEQPKETTIDDIIIDVLIDIIPGVSFVKGAIKNFVTRNVKKILRTRFAWATFAKSKMAKELIKEGYSETIVSHFSGKDNLLQDLLSDEYVRSFYSELVVKVMEEDIPEIAGKIYQGGKKFKRKTSLSVTDSPGVLVSNDSLEYYRYQKATQSLILDQLLLDIQMGFLKEKEIKVLTEEIEGILKDDDLREEINGYSEVKEFLKHHFEYCIWVLTYPTAKMGNVGDYEFPPVPEKLLDYLILRLCPEGIENGSYYAKAKNSSENVFLVRKFKLYELDKGASQRALIELSKDWGELSRKLLESKAVLIKLLKGTN